MVGCPTCGRELSYIAQYNRHYCYSCRSYAPKEIIQCASCGRALVFVPQYSRHYCYGCQEYKSVEPKKAANPCPTCGGDLAYIPQYDRYYCYSCKAYAPLQARPAGDEGEATASSSQGEPMSQMSSGQEQPSSEESQEGRQQEDGGHSSLAPFSRQDLESASKEQLMRWCQDFGLDATGMKYELRNRLLEYVERRGKKLREVSGLPLTVERAAPTETKVKEEMFPAEAAHEAELQLEEKPPIAEREQEIPGPTLVRSVPRLVEISREEVKPVEEKKVIKPEPAKPAKACSTCGASLSYIGQYDRWYCYRCQAYAPKEVSVGAQVFPRTPSVQSVAQPQVTRFAPRGATVPRSWVTYRQGNPQVGISLMLLGLGMYIAYAILFSARQSFDLPTPALAPEIGFALSFLSYVFVVIGAIASILLLRIPVRPKV